MHACFYSQWKKNFVFKNNFIEVIFQIITRLDKKYIQDKYVDVLAEVLISSAFDIEVSLKMINFIIENEIDVNASVILEVYEDITDRAEEEELEKFTDIVKKIEEFIEK